MSEKSRPFLVILATIGLIAVNYFAGTGQINNTTPGEISDAFPTRITPAGYAFSIWSVIYIGLIGFSGWQILPAQIKNPRLKTVRSLYILNCALNCIWIYLWHYRQIPFSILAMIGILGTLVLINVQLKDSATSGEFWLARVPFQIYFGWITAALILNAAIVFVSFDFLPAAPISNALGIALLLAAAALAFIIRRGLNAVFYAFAVAWALAAIAYAHFNNLPIGVTAAVCAAAALLAAVLPFGSKRAA